MDDESLRADLRSLSSQSIGSAERSSSGERGRTLESLLTAPPREELERLLGFSLDPATYRKLTAGPSGLPKPGGMDEAPPNPPEEPEPSELDLPEEPAPLPGPKVEETSSLAQASQDGTPPKPKPPLSPGSPVEP